MSSKKIVEKLGHYFSNFNSSSEKTKFNAKTFAKSKSLMKIDPYIGPVWSLPMSKNGM